MTGTVYLVPNLLGVAAPETALPPRTVDVARRLRHWRVETPKAARAFLKSLALDAPIATLDIVGLPESPTAADCHALLAVALAGDDVGVLSDAGCPGVADPGAGLRLRKTERRGGRRLAGRSLLVDAGRGDVERQREARQKFAPIAGRRSQDERPNGVVRCFCGHFLTMLGDCAIIRRLRAGP